MSNRVWVSFKMNNYKGLISNQHHAVPGRLTLPNKKSYCGDFGVPPLKHRRYPWDTDVTICIAAIADWWHDPKIVLCSDTRIEMQDFASANTGNKLGRIAKHWLALLAGNLPHAKELVTYYQDHLANEPESSEVSETISQFRIPPQNMKKARIKQHLQMKWGMSYDDFTTKGNHAIPQDLYQATWREIESIQLQCELILAGFIGTRAHLFSYDDQFDVVHCEHFATIGSGSWIAKAVLFQRGCHGQMSLEEVVYYVYEAKRLSEIALAWARKLKW
jgi:20S proteasome alpha/beta subunit